MRTPIRLQADFPIETLQTRREWDDKFQVSKKKTSPNNTIHGKAVPLKWRRDKYFSRKQKLIRKFITTKTALEEMLTVVLAVEIKIWEGSIKLTGNGKNIVNPGKR